jgi:hypothetical protein
VSKPGDSSGGFDVRAMLALKKENDDLRREITAANARIDLLQGALERARATINSALGVQS